MRKLWKRFIKRVARVVHWWRMRKIRRAIDNDEDPFIYD